MGQEKWGIYESVNTSEGQRSDFLFQLVWFCFCLLIQTNIFGSDKSINLWVCNLTFVSFSQSSSLSLFLQLREKLTETCNKKGRVLQSRPNAPQSRPKTTTQTGYRHRHSGETHTLDTCFYLIISVHVNPGSSLKVSINSFSSLGPFGTKFPCKHVA